MARTPLAARPAISQWLIGARKSAGFENVGAFLDALRAETGGAPHYATYAQWESGATTPKDDSLAPVFAFYATRGIVAPEKETPAPQVSLEERAVVAAEAQATALRELVEELRLARLDRAKLEALAATVDQLVAASLGHGDSSGRVARDAPPASAG